MKHQKKSYPQKQVSSIFITNNPSETIEAGRAISRTVTQGTVICLSGELGAGKTTLLKGLAAGIGIKNAEKKITSSSFVLAREFPKENFYHIDLFRLNQNDFFLAGLDQYVSDKNIVAVEWSDRLKDVIIKDCINIKIKMQGGNRRKIIVSK